VRNSNQIAIASLCAVVAFMTSSCQSGPYDCFGMKAARNFSVRLVDDAAAPVTYADPGLRVASVSGVYGSNLPSCEEFDGVAVGSVIDLEDATLATRSGGPFCSIVRADATLRGGQHFEGIRTSGRFDEHVFTGGGAMFTVVSRGSVAGCPGSWVLDFDLGELINKYDERTHEPWSKEKLFDPGEAGGQAPVLAARLFQVDAGASCPALPSSVTRCVDIYLGRFEPTAP